MPKSQRQAIPSVVPVVVESIRELLEQVNTKATHLGRVNGGGKPRSSLLHRIERPAIVDERHFSATVFTAHTHVDFVATLVSVAVGHRVRNRLVHAELETVGEIFWQTSARTCLAKPG
jgi:hypothetical protein